MKKLTDFEKDLKKELRNPEFRKLYEKEEHRLRIAYEITQLRKGQKLTQKKLAEKIGTSQSAVARIEAGEQNVSTDKLQEIASAFDRNIEIKFVK